MVQVEMEAGGGGGEAGRGMKERGREGYKRRGGL